MTARRAACFLAAIPAAVIGASLVTTWWYNAVYAPRIAG